MQGAALTELGKFEDAETLLLSSIEPLEQAPIPGISDQNRERLAALYGAWKKPEEAQKYRGTE